MTNADRDRRRREIQEATRDHNERMAERRAKAVLEAREALLGPGSAADLPIGPDREPSRLQTRVASLFEKWNRQGLPAERVRADGGDDSRFGGGGADCIGEVGTHWADG